MEHVTHGGSPRGPRREIVWGTHGNASSPDRASTYSAGATCSTPGSMRRHRSRAIASVVVQAGLDAARIADWNHCAARCFEAAVLASVKGGLR